MLLLAMTSSLSAQGAQVAFGAIQQDTSLPVEVTSEELAVNQADGTAIFTGNVVVGQGEMRLTAPRVLVVYREDTRGIDRPQLHHLSAHVDEDPGCHFRDDQSLARRLAEGRGLRLQPKADVDLGGALDQGCGANLKRPRLVSGNELVSAKPRCGHETQGDDCSVHAMVSMPCP